MFVQGVLAGNAHVGRAVLDVGRDVARADDHDSQIRIIGSDNELAGGFRILERIDSGSG